MKGFKMTKAEVKREVARKYGFAMNKITLLEYDDEGYVNFEVCGREYTNKHGDLEIRTYEL